MSSKYWPPMSLVMEGNTSDIYDHCCMKFDGSAYIVEGFWLCKHCHQIVVDTDEAQCYNNIERAAPATSYIRK